MLETILYIFITALYFLAFIVMSLHYVHMLQLSSYKYSSFLKWYRITGLKEYLSMAGVLILIMPFTLLINKILFYIYSVIAAVAAAYLSRPRKAKKPLVYTSRVIRLLATLALLLAVASVGIFFIPSVWVRPFMLLAAYLLIPFFVLLANLINAPVQHAVNRWFINDAKKKLKSHSGLKVIGITGSYGKTSTKYFLYRLLSEKYNVLMTPESFNTTLGVVKTVRSSLSAAHEYFIAEMGAKHIGDVKEIADIVRPEYGILTSIGPQHLETFKTIDNVIKTKFELIDSLPADGVAFLNYGNEYIRSHKTGKKTVSYAVEGEADYTAADISVDSSGSRFTVHAPSGESCEFRTGLLGRHNIENLLGAIAMANYLGIRLEDLIYPVARLEAVPHRLQLKRIGRYTMIDDAYNSNPKGSKMALEVLSSFRGTRILVTPGMVELGSMQEQINEEFGAYAFSRCDYAILVKSPFTDAIGRGLRRAGFDEGRIILLDDVMQAFSKVGEIAQTEPDCYALFENDLPDNYTLK